jgi:hypothetical protein
LVRGTLGWLNDNLSVPLEAFYLKKNEFQYLAEPLDFIPGHPSLDNHLSSGALISGVGILICKKILHWKNIFSKLGIEKDLFCKFNSAIFLQLFFDMARPCFALRNHLVRKVRK